MMNLLSRFLSMCFAVFFAAAPLPADSLRPLVEEDWRRQDEKLLERIREPGPVWLGGERLEWPGAKPDPRRRVPLAPSPALDGRLDDACWRGALALPTAAAGQPAFFLCHDGGRFYIAASLPSALEERFGEHFTSRDAAGAVDGVKDGTYGFHTWLEADPWWQVDLGEPALLRKIVVYNRLDYAPGLHNADHLLIWTSADGESWTLRHDNAGRHFGGVKNGDPLAVELKGEPGEAGARARFVRLGLRRPAPVFFHLDEVEVYGAAEPEKNLARGRPARQSSLSIWSRGGQRGCALFALGKIRVGLVPGGDLVTIDGLPAPAEQARVRREGGKIVVEAALPLSSGEQEPGLEFLPPEGDPIPIAAGGSFQIARRDAEKLGFGRNRFTLEILAAGPIEPPAEIDVEAAVFTAQRLERQAILSRRLGGAASLPLEFVLAGEGAAAVWITLRQGKTSAREGWTFFIEPVRETLERTGKLLADFNLLPPARLSELRRRAEALASRELAGGPDPAARAALYREARWLHREVAFQNPLLAFDRLLFVKRFTQETYPDVCLNHMPWVSRPGGDLCILSGGRSGSGLLTGGEDDAVEARALLNGALGPGHVHGLDLWWDADRVVFGYARAKSDQPPAGWLDRRTSYDLRRAEEPIRLFEMNIDGSGLRQLTRGEWSDLDPTYLPSGDIAFVSERCGYSLQCNECDKDETSCNLYVMRPDGGDIRRLSVTKDGDYLPHALDDGTIGYTRWEYQERGWAHIQSIWTIRPDGTGADAVFKQHFNDPWALEDVRSIPGSRKLVCIATGHHTLPAGPVVVIDPSAGLNNPEGIRIVTPGVVPPEGGMSGAPVPEGGVSDRGGHYMTPWALSEKYFLASYTFGGQTDPSGYAIYLLDVHGTKELITRDPKISCFSPIPLRLRPRPPVLASEAAPAAAEAPLATLLVSEVGRGLEGIEPGQVRYLRIANRIPWPYDNRRGGQRYEPDAKAVMINWTPARILGIVPVEADGSAYFQVPADLAVYFQLLDENFMELRRMRSFISFQPGETRACAGCHETRAAAPSPGGAPPLALRREPSIPEPPPWGFRPLSFLRDVQPVLDRRCASCHGGLKPAAGLDFSAGLTAERNRAYDTILAHGLVARSNVGDDAKITPALAFGSHRSKLVQVLREGRHKDDVKLSAEEWLRLVTWIDANAPYHDGFIDKRPEVPPYDLAADAGLARRLAALHSRRCAPCHQPGEVSRLDWIDLRAPRQSLFLTAPLSQRAGGAGKCQGGGACAPGAEIYADKSDPDYRMALDLVSAAVEEAWKRPRRDLKALPRRLP